MSLFPMLCVFNLAPRQLLAMINSDAETRVMQFWIENIGTNDEGFKSKLIRPFDTPMCVSITNKLSNSEIEASCRRKVHKIPEIYMYSKISVTVYEGI